MAELVCGAHACSYNKDNCCCKGDIMVGGKHADTCACTCCESFRNRQGDSFSDAMSKPSLNISIDCEAVKCVYNSNHRCQAEKVAIRGSHAASSEGTICETFQEK